MLALSRSGWGLALLVLAVLAGQQLWAGLRQQDLGERVAQLARPGDIHMLSSETCAICTVARQWFTRHRVPFTECLIERDAACRQALEATRSPGTPVLMVRGRPQVGFDPQRLRTALERPI